MCLFCLPHLLLPLPRRVNIATVRKNKIVEELNFGYIAMENLSS